MKIENNLEDRCSLREDADPSGRNGSEVSRVEEVPEKQVSECTTSVMYEAGFKGLNLYDRLTEDGIDCVVIPPHLVTEPKVNKIKTDKRDARRLALVLETGISAIPALFPTKTEERTGR